MFPENARKLRGFNWRGKERILSVKDLFNDDPPLILPTIKGLEERDLNDGNENSIKTSTKKQNPSIKNKTQNISAKKSN